jgi:RNA polymerase sigma-70 factor (ECF subfamily)
MEQLKKRLARGETEAFVEVYDLLGEKLLRYLTARLNPTDAHDVMQNVFARIVRYHKHFARSKNLTAYVFLTARNESNRWIKKHRQARPSSTTGLEKTTLENSDQTTNQPVGRQLEQAELVEFLIHKLSSESQEIIRLKIYSDLTFPEISKVLKLPESTVATKYRRAILKMQSSVNSLEDPEPRATTIKR